MRYHSTLKSGAQKSTLALLIPAMLTLSLAACDEQQIGTIAGAAAGAAGGKAIAGDGTKGYIGLILGAVVGGYLGGELGKRLSNRDKEQQAAATNRVLDTGQTTSWANAETGAKGTVSAQPTFKNSANEVCRDFSSSATVSDGTSGTGQGTACKQADGTWRIVKQG
jgi:surface antigen